MKIVSSIVIDCVEHEDLVYFRWSENDWRIQCDDGEIIELTEEVEWLEPMFKAVKAQQKDGS